MGINESKLPLDQIGDSESDLENGTVDFDDEQEYEFDKEIISLGAKIDNDEDNHYDKLAHQRNFSRKDKDDDLRLDFTDYNDEDEDIDFISSHDVQLMDDVPIDLKENFNAGWVETLDMFNRILK